MKELKIFENEAFGEIRTLETDDGKVLFCASDVASALGYSNKRDAISRHCRCVVKHDTPHPQSPGKTIEMSFIPEGDVYRLIAHSKLPKAVEFESWVFDEVLPTIRKTGSYGTQSISPMNIPKIIECAGERVLTTAQLAEAYETSKSTINTNFSRNKKRYVEGKHFFFLVGEDLRAFKKSLTNCKELSQVPQLYLWTERGVLLHAKSLNTDKALAVYDFLVEYYFRKSALPPKEPLTAEQCKQKLTATLLSELRHKQAALATAEAQLAVQKAEAAIQRRAVADFVMLHPELMPYAHLIEAHD